MHSLDDHYKTVLSILEKYKVERSEFVYGSRAKGVSRKESDLDLVIIGHNQISKSTLWAIQEDLAESDIPFRTEIRAGAELTDSFLQQISPDLKPMSSLINQNESRP